MMELDVRRLDFGKKVLLVAAVMGALGQVSAGQSGSATQVDNSTAKLPVYDVVSIKPNKSGSGSVSIDSNNDRYSATNVRLKTLLENAYGIKEGLISGMPEPISSARFDIEVKIVDRDLDALKKLNPKQEGEMLLPFLIERFQLKAHAEIKTLPVYELVVIKGGPKFMPSPSDSKRGGGTSINNNGRRSELTAHDRSMASLASTLDNQVHRTVIDKTGLKDNYDFALTWAPDDRPETQDDSVPSIFTALPEQLGLKLQPAKGSVVTLVVDHVEMPSEN